MKTAKLCRNSDFRRVYKRGRSLVGRFVVIYYLKNSLGYNRMGITVSKKLGSAPVRNRIKRLVSESWRLSEDGLKKGYDFVIVARSACTDVKMMRVKDCLCDLLMNQGLMAKPANPENNEHEGAKHAGTETVSAAREGAEHEDM